MRDGERLSRRPSSREGTRTASKAVHGQERSTPPYAAVDTVVASLVVGHCKKASCFSLSICGSLTMVRVAKGRHRPSNRRLNNYSAGRTGRHFGQVAIQTGRQLIKGRLG